MQICYCLGSRERDSGSVLVIGLIEWGEVNIGDVEEFRWCLELVLKVLIFVVAPVGGVVDEEVGSRNGSGFVSGSFGDTAGLGVQNVLEGMECVCVEVFRVFNECQRMGLRQAAFLEGVVRYLSDCASKRCCSAVHASCVRMDGLVGVVELGEVCL